MTFEAQLTRAFDTLTERLRGEIDQQVRRTAAEVIAAAPADRAPSDAPSADTAARERLAEGFQAIDRARSLTAILDTLVAFAREDGARADIWLMRGGRAHHWRAPGSDGSQDDTQPRPLDEGIPITISGAVVARLFAEPRTPSAEPRTTNVELLTRYAARSLEALTAFMTARALIERQDEPDRAAPAGDGTIADEDTSARRYARLLVSEIKLYHEPAVVDGRRDRDLATRLGGEITRARVMYEQRVPPHVRGRADYFHDELVRTLANGDASLLEVRT